MNKSSIATPPRVRIRLQDAFGNPLKTTHYKIGWLMPDGKVNILPEPPIRRTDDKGILDEPVPLGVTTGGVKVFIQDTLAWTFKINILDLKPAANAEGMKARLSNLGFMALRQIDGSIDEPLRRATQRFRKATGFQGGDLATRVEDEHER